MKTIMEGEAFRSKKCIFVMNDASGMQWMEESSFVPRSVGYEDPDLGMKTIISYILGLWLPLPPYHSYPGVLMRGLSIG
jgi:hypothetical protein